jgi:hypothetical protein
MSLFNKVTNTDILSSIITVENKLDVLLCRLNEKTLEGCDCVKNEQCKPFTDLDELKLYLEERLNTFELHMYEKFTSLDESVRQVIDCHDEKVTLSSVYKSVKDSHLQEVELLEHFFKDVNTTLGSITFDNETIKQKFLLQEQIRKNEDEIESLRDKIKSVLKEVTVLIREAKT